MHTGRARRNRPLGRQPQLPAIHNLAYFEADGHNHDYCMKCSPELFPRSEDGGRNGLTSVERTPSAEIVPSPPLTSRTVPPGAIGDGRPVREPFCK